MAAYVDQHHQQQKQRQQQLLILPQRLVLDANPRLTPDGIARHLGRLLRLYGSCGGYSSCYRLDLSLAHTTGVDLAGPRGAAFSGVVAALAEAAMEGGTGESGGALASLNVEGSTLDVAAVRALAGLVKTVTGLESISLTLPPFTAATADAAEAAVEALLDAAAESPSLRHLGLEGHRGYLTDGVIAAILRAERAFERNRERAQAQATAAAVDVHREPTLSELVLSILFDGRGGLADVENDGNGGKEEDVATTVTILRRLLRSVKVCVVEYVPLSESIVRWGLTLETNGHINLLQQSFR